MVRLTRKKNIIIHFFYKFKLGGAETAFKRLVDYDLGSERKHYIFVFSKRDFSDLPSNIKDIKLFQLFKLRKNYQNISFYGWLYNGALIAFFCSLIFKKIKITFSIHNPWREKDEINYISYILNNFFINISKSSRVKKIIFPDILSKKTHNLVGVPTFKSEVVPNGFDIRFNELDSLSNNQKNNFFKLLYVGRYDEVKDIPFLIEILSLWIKNLDEANKKRIIIDFWGHGLNKSNIELLNLLKKEKIIKYVSLNGLKLT